MKSGTFSLRSSLPPNSSRVSSGRTVAAKRPFKVLQSLGVQLTTRLSRSDVSHVSICSPPSPSCWASWRCTSRAVGVEGGGASGLMNVRSVLITPLNYINPLSELRRVTGAEGSEVSEVKPLPPPPSAPPPATLPPSQIPVLSLNCSLLFTAASSHPPCNPPPSVPPRRCRRSLVSLCCSFVSLRQEKVPLMDPRPPAPPPSLLPLLPLLSGCLSENESCCATEITGSEVPLKARLVFNQTRAFCGGVLAAAARHK